LAAVLGFGAGLCIGPVSLLAVFARHVWRAGEEWPEWSPEFLLSLLVTSTPAAVNGAVGAVVASRWDRLDRWPVTVLPVVLHLIVGVAAMVREPQSLVGLQLYTLAFTAVIWSAGRIGQRVGRALGRPDALGEPGSPTDPPVAGVVST
jgi:hypothetical protein